MITIKVNCKDANGCDKDFLTIVPSVGTIHTALMDVVNLILTMGWSYCSHDIEIEGAEDDNT